MTEPSPASGSTTDAFFAEELRESHTHEAVRERLSGAPRVSYLRDLIYGAVDGAVTTFAIVAGVSGASLSLSIVIALGAAIITSDENLWVDPVLQEEHGLTLREPSAWKAAFAIFAAFFVIGAVPLLPFVVDLSVAAGETSPFVWSVILTGSAFFAVGAMKSRFDDQSSISVGLETLGIGAEAAALAFAVGFLLRGLVATDSIR